MTRQELRVFLNGWFCGCGDPQAAAATLLALLSLHPLDDHREEFEQLVPDAGIQWLLLYMLDHLGLTEHGGNVGGAWLTAKGQNILDALGREKADGFEALTAPCCVHGYDIEGSPLAIHDCFTVDAQTSGADSVPVR